MQISDLLNPCVIPTRRFNMPSRILTDKPSLAYLNRNNPYYDARIAPSTASPSIQKPFHVSGLTPLYSTSTKFVFPSPNDSVDSPTSSLQYDYTTHSASSPSPQIKSALPGRSKRKASYHQIAILEKVWVKNKFPTTEQTEIIGSKVGMKGYSVKFWFQNKRQSEASVLRKMNLEVPKWNGQRFELDFGDLSLVENMLN